jgi:hypothetical protein
MMAHFSVFVPHDTFRCAMLNSLPRYVIVSRYSLFISTFHFPLHFVQIDQHVVFTDLLLLLHLLLTAV